MILLQSINSLWGHMTLQPASKFSGALWRWGGKRKEGLQLRLSLEFKYLHRKRRCAMLIGGKDIANDVNTLGTCFSMFFLHSHSFPLRSDWGKTDSSVNGEPQGNWRWNSNSRGVIASYPFFSAPPTKRPGELACRLISK